jgi:hypothetical protein
MGAAKAAFPVEKPRLKLAFRLADTPDSSVFGITDQVSAVRTDLIS